MGRKKTLHKEWLKAKRFTKKLNKQLKEDVFEGRFQLVLTGNKKDFSQSNYGIYVPELLTAENAGDPTWQYSVYEVRLEDTEQQERSFAFWCEYSDTFGLINCSPADVENQEKMQKYSQGFSGIRSAVTLVNNFIVYSDFWEQWKNPEYKKNHWYSGEQLKRAIEIGGSSFKNPK